MDWKYKAEIKSVDERANLPVTKELMMEGPYGANDTVREMLVNGNIRRVVHILLVGVVPGTSGSHDFDSTHLALCLRLTIFGFGNGTSLEHELFLLSLSLEREAHQSGHSDC